MANRRNYRVEMERIISRITESGARPRLLLHSCCAPCSTTCLEILAPVFDVTVFYYNPNILPGEEWEKRLYWLKYLLDTAPFCRNVKLIVPERDEENFLTLARGREQLPEGGARCEDCFRLRLGRTAEAAAEGGYEWFTTTLTVSPHKNPVLLNRLGEELAPADGPRWLPAEFRRNNGYDRSLELSREYGLYRQSWCGCGFPEEGRL